VSHIHLPSPQEVNHTVTVKGGAIVSRTVEQKSQEFIDRIDPELDSALDRKDVVKRFYYATLVKEQIQQGCLDDAIKTAQKTNSFSFLAESYARKAVEEAKKGIDTGESIR